MGLARAADFVASHGDALARGRAQLLAAAGGSAERVIERIEAPAPSDVAALERALAICDELRAPRSALAGRCCAALESLQAADGSLAAPDADDADRLTATGRLGGLLARSPFARPETLERAGDFLAQRFTPDLLQGFQYANVAAYARYFANAMHDACDEILQWCGRELERGFRAREFDALATAHVLAVCDAHALPGARLTREELLLGLIAEQHRDGSYGPAPEPRARVETTLQGLRGLRFLGAGVDSPLAAR